jgi:two-component system response regulator RegA
LIDANKLGATHYLTNPTDADEIVAAFDREKGKTDTEVEGQPLALDRLEWEHIQKVLADCNGSISAAAHQLKLHRRTLQRKLQKRPSGIQ